MTLAARAAPRLDAVLQRLMALHPKSIDLSLDRVKPLLRALGSPHEKLPPVVHVAGTNGKGSLVAYLRAMTEAAGRRAHVYTSPHLVRFNERIRLAGELIGDEYLIELLERCETVNAGKPITFFEITNAAAFLAFAEVPADVVLLETGLGGRFDSTNVIDRPALTAITPISYDHQAFLGDTLSAIAFEKAGIMKPGVPCVLGPQTAEPAAVFRARAAELSVMLDAHGTDWMVQDDGGEMVWQGKATLRLPLPALPGRHQIFNAGTALACVQHLPQLGIDAAAMARGLRSVEWPARLQRLTRGPLLDLLPDGAELWLDGGHNPAAGEVLAQMAADWRGTDARPLHLVSGMLNTKDPRGLLAPLKPYADSIATVAIPGEPNSLSAADMAAAARDVGLNVRTASNLSEAIRAVPRDGPPRVLICGSLYLAGQVLADNS